MQFSVVVTVYEKDQMFLPHIATCLANQTFNDFELFVVVDGQAPLTYDPRHIFSKMIAAEVVCLPASRSHGYRERHHSLQLAHGDYIAWLDVNNLVYPNWLQNHAENIRKAKGGISIVNIQYWQSQTNSYWGVLPLRLAEGGMDLLNYALPLELARRLDVFGPKEEFYAADFYAFERCSKEAPVIWKRDQPVCGCHF